MYMHAKAIWLVDNTDITRTRPCVSAEMMP